MMIRDFEEVDEALGGGGSWFSAKLIRLIADADESNRNRLREGFPAEVAFVERRLGRKGKTEVFGFGDG